MENPSKTRYENPTDGIFRNEYEKEMMLRAYERAQRLLEKESIKPEEFEEMYDKELLAKCKNYVASCENAFEKNRESEGLDWMRAEIFGKTLEGILHHQINEGIFGENIKGVSTTKYDDYYAGIDEVIEGRNLEGFSYIGCSLDLTFGHPEKKISSIIDNIKAGVLNEVLFYKSPFGDPSHLQGKLRGVPKVVIGMDAEHVTKLSEQWTNNDKEQLTQNQIFLVLLQQIQKQAEVYTHIAKRMHKTEIADRYEQLYNFIKKLYEEQKKSKQIDMLDTNIKNDSVNQAINSELEKLLNLK